MQYGPPQFGGLIHTRCAENSDLASVRVFVETFAEMERPQAALLADSDALTDKCMTFNRSKNWMDEEDRRLLELHARADRPSRFQRR
jgi:hypothetical protein